MKQKLDLPNHNNGDQFVTWGKAVSDFLTAAGLPKTSAPGQVDWNTAAPPTSRYDNTYYEIRQFNDALQASAPVYLKIVYSSGYEIDEAAIGISVGSQENGAGSVSLPYDVGGYYILNGFYTHSEQVLPCYLSASPNRLAIAMYIDNGSAFFTALERSKDAGGNDTSEGVYFSALGQNTASANSDNDSLYLPFESNRLVVTERQNFLIPELDGSLANGQRGTDVPFFPPYFFDYGFVKNAGTTHLAYFKDDLTELTEVNVQVYGSERNYLLLPYIESINHTASHSAQCAIAMLYE